MSDRLPMPPTVLVVRQNDGKYQVTVWTGCTGAKPATQAMNLPLEQAQEVARSAFLLLERVQQMAQARLN